jgi:hypothetical protein
MEINYRKIKQLNLDSLAENYEPTAEDDQNGYNPFAVLQIQSFNPLYDEFFVLNETNYNRVGLNHVNYVEKDVILSADGQPRPYHVKCSPLLDPIHYLVGKYDVNSAELRVLPTLSGPPSHPKIANKQNASYVDGFFCYLSSQMTHKYNMLNAIDFYGSYLAVQRVFKANISDDVEYLYQSPFFMENLGKHFSVSCGASNHGCVFDDFTGVGSRTNKKRLVLGDEIVPEIDGDLCDKEEVIISVDETPTCEYEKSSCDSSSASSSSSEDELNYSSPEEEEDSEDDIEEDDDTEDAEDAEAYAYIKDFPTNLIFVEKCDGTLDQLFLENKMDAQKGAACLIQIIMSLIAFQKAFQLTHNDLHTNNIMYVNTDIEWLYYKYDNVFYRVPTYGRIFKIIDFGRAIYRFKTKRYCSDSFAPKGDAHSQYNTEPYFNERRPRIEPNPSFDLCRLGTSIYDFIIPDEDSPRDELQETICRWCLDDNGKNVMYKRNGEERYPGFKLYKMIAKNVHAHTPQAQLKYQFFYQFVVAPLDAAKIDEQCVRKYGLNIDLVARE